MRLFKFVPSKRIDILADERIAFTPPGKFSDPSEMRIELSPAAKKEFKRRLYEQVEKQAMHELPGYSKISARQRKRGRKDMTRGLNIGGVGNETFQATIQKEFQKIGVLCLCTNIKSHLMWDHYAEGFRGFVIEFDSDHDDFKKLGSPWEVDYENKPPLFDYSRPVPEFFRHKPECYAYEGEYRIFRPLWECTSVKDKTYGEIFFRPLPRACVKAIYLGHRMEKNMREAILSILKDSKTKKIDVDFAQRDYELTFREIK